PFRKNSLRCWPGQVVLNRTLAINNFRAHGRGTQYMAQASLLATTETKFGETARRDNWWVGPLATFLGLLAFVVYATWRAFDGNWFEVRQNHETFNAPGNRAVAPYLSPFFSPLIYDAQSHHAWITQEKPSWWPTNLPFSTALLILGGPVLFRFTC